MTKSSLLLRADAFADEAAAAFRDLHRAFVQRLDHARRVQARLVAQGISDEAILAAARLYPLCPAGQVTAPLLTVSMVLGDMVAEPIGEAIASLTEDVAAQLVYRPDLRRRRLPSKVRIILKADRWCSKLATLSPRTYVDRQVASDWSLSNCVKKL